MSTTLLSGIVKQVLSGDTIHIRDKPKDRCPNVKTIILMSITAPRLGRKKKDGGEEKDEPYAWEAREYLRKKLICKEVKFFSKPFPTSGNSTDRELGKIYFPTKEDDITEELLANGLAKLKKEISSGKQSQDPELKKLIELEEKARNENKGIWSKDKDKHVRNVKYIKDGFVNFVSEHAKKPTPAIIEQVRDGAVKMILEVLMLPNFYSVPVAISGVKFPADEFKEEAKYFIECRLLQQDDVQVVIEKACNSYVAGSIIHPKGNIAELLLKEGFARCDDGTMITSTTGAVKLRAAESYAKEKRLRIWKNQLIPSGPKVAKKEFQGIVSEIMRGEALMIKICSTGEMKKVFLASIRFPKDTQSQVKKDGGDDVGLGKDKPRQPMRGIFDVPWLFEAREFLRKKLIGKRVNVIVDYVQPAKDGFAEKTCCSIIIGGNNIAEEMVLNGLATVVRHRDEDNRSSHYDALSAAEQNAIENHKGVHSKGEPPKYRVNECTGTRATGLFPMLQKANRIKAIVEHVPSGARLKIYIPKDSLMITFLLSGICCPKAGGGGSKVGARSIPVEPFGVEAQNFTKEKVLQREVEIQIEQHDKGGNMIGSLFVGNLNLALALVEEGLASVHIPSAERSVIQAEKVAKEKKLNMWQNVQEEKHDNNEDDTPERSLNYKEVFITSVTPDLHVYALHIDQKPLLDELQGKMRNELNSNPPICFSKGVPPHKGKLYAAKFDNEWYRGKVEKVFGSSCKAIVNYVDYGNKESVLFEDLAPLPDFCMSAKPFAHEYGLACVMKPPEHYIVDVVHELYRELENRTLRINVEYNEHNLSYVSIMHGETNEDCIKTCIAKGFFYADNCREKKFRALLDEYLEAQAEAKKKRSFIWEYGDAREDDAKEFGLGK